MFSLYREGEPEPIVEIGLALADRDDGEMHTLQISFEVTEPESIEPRVTAGDARLWLHKVVFD